MLLLVERAHVLVIEVSVEVVSNDRCDAKVKTPDCEQPNYTVKNNVVYEVQDLAKFF